jgi:hypothetical protein
MTSLVAAASSAASQTLHSAEALLLHHHHHTQTHTRSFPVEAAGAGAARVERGERSKVDEREREGERDRGPLQSVLLDDSIARCS